jgi:ATP-dependent metalloprotease
MGGHVAEKLIVGTDFITSGCGSDLQNATNLATAAVRQFGMFGNEIGFATIAKKQSSDE